MSWADPIQYVQNIANNWKSWAEPFEHLVVGLASIVGGIWIVLRLWRERAFDTALGIDVRVSPPFAGAPQLTFLQVTLRNKGKVQLQAKESKPPAFQDKGETVPHSCTLQLKKLLSSSPDVWINWFDRKNFDPNFSLEVNLLSEFEDTAKGMTDFWMEPGEAYRLGVPLSLPRAVYLGKVTFIGEGSDREFWSRIFVVDVP